MVFTLVFWLILTLIFRAWAQRIDRRQLSSFSSVPLPQGVRHWLLLYVPSPSAIMVLHILFYAGLLLVGLGYHEYFLSGNMGVSITSTSGASVNAPIFLALPLCYIALVTLIVRDWAAMYHPSGDAARKRMRWLFLRAPARPAGLLALALYYASALI